eukprot:PITA_36198
MGMEIMAPDFPTSFQIVNIYGPCQGREAFWLDLLEKSLMKMPLMVVGGDLNFSLGRAEAWGPSAREDPLTEFFIQTLKDHNLIDPSPISLMPTWRNRRIGEDRIAKRLDRFLTSEGLIRNVPLFQQLVEATGNSDHFPIFLDLSFPPPKPPAPFKFNSSWLEEPSFNSLFKSTWICANRNSLESKSFLFMENLKRLKKATMTWAKERQKNQNEEMIKISEELKSLESMDSDGYATQSSKDRILSLEKAQNQILLAKEKEWRLKSRAIWLKDGDENTRFFHNFAKGTIWSLKYEEGREVKSFTDLSCLGQRHFQRIFSDPGETTIAEIIRTTQCFPRFTEEGADDELSAPVTKEEVEAAMKSMGKDKSPGPDGCTVELFLHFFDLIGSDIVDVVEESRLRGEIYKPFNSTFIALIPKKDAPESFEDFRPISLCNCIYKIIAKVIATRLIPILSRNISMEQFGFLEGRQIHEAIGVAQEVIHSVKQKRKKGVILKIDLSKAYDQISWLYLRLLLTHLGFNYSFISWIMGCITNVSFAVLINGAASPFFKSQRGLRQGCPLSPLLFLLVAEGLSRLIHSARRSNKIKGIEVAINLYISHLLFVDDILIFSNGSHNELKELKDIFDLFMKASGMLINSGKSQVCVAGFNRRECNAMTNLFPFQTQSLDSSFKYLGFWLKPDAYKKEDWNWLIAKIEARISHWSFRWLSRAGRLTLLKSVLLAIPVYWVALTWIPKGILEKIRRLCCRFLWAGSSEKSVLPWVAWEKIARPKEWGGWGIKQLPEFSLSLAAKSGWRLITDKKTKHSSIIWKATVEAFFEIEKGLAWKVGDGRNVRIGRDPWVGCNKSYALSPGILRHLDSKGFYTLNQVEKVGLSTIWGQAWKSAVELGLDFRWHNEWSTYIDELHRSNVRIKLESDVLLWAHGKTGLYSPKEGYAYLMDQKGWAAPEWWSRNLWKLKCPMKSRVFLWCLLKRKIPTWDILQNRFFIGPGRCPLCKADGESINHLFISCSVSFSIWGELVKMINIRVQWEPVSLDEVWRKRWNDHPDSNLRNLLPIFFWGVWLTRNKSTFQDQAFSPTTVASKCAAIYSSLPPPESSTAPNRDAPLIINENFPWAFFDGASQQNRAGAGICIYINNKHSIKASVGLGLGSNDFAELAALHLLMCWSLQKNILRIQIYGDSMNVINWVNGKSICQNQILKVVLDEILSLKSHFNNISFCHIYREKNTIADQLSKTGLQQVLGSWSIEEMRQGQTFHSQLPPFAPLA